MQNFILAYTAYTEARWKDVFLRIKVIFHFELTGRQANFGLFCQYGRKYKSK